MNKKKHIKTKTAKEISEVLGLTHADAIDWEIRLNLTQKIIEIVKKKKLTITKVAKNAGTSRARVTQIMNGSSIGMSIDILIRILASLGQKVEVKFKRVA